jgi:hypothetical protein
MGKLDLNMPFLLLLAPSMAVDPKPICKLLQLPKSVDLRVDNKSIN